jgi:hypothetical protein
MIGSDAANESTADQMLALDNDSINCSVDLSNAKLAFLEISGFTAIKCDNCILVRSRIEFLGGMSFVSQASAFGITIQMNESRFSEAEFFETKLSGNAACRDFSHADFFASDLTNLSLEFSNLSGVDFHTGGFRDTAELRRSEDWLRSEYYRTDSLFTEQAAVWLEEQSWGGVIADDPNDRPFDVDRFGSVTNRLPSSGLSNAWVWSDMPVTGLPDGMQGPTRCDASLRGEPITDDAGNTVEAVYSRPPEGCMKDRASQIKKVCGG